MYKPWMWRYKTEFFGNIPPVKFNIPCLKDENELFFMNLVRFKLILSSRRQYKTGKIKNIPPVLVKPAV